MVELAAAVREQEKEQEYLGMQIYFPEKRFTEFIRLRRFLSLHSQGLNDIGKKHLPRGGWRTEGKKAIRIKLERRLASDTRRTRSH